MYNKIKEIFCVLVPCDKLYILESYENNYLIFDCEDILSDFVYIDLNNFRNVIFGNLDTLKINNVRIEKFEGRYETLVEISYESEDYYYEINTTLKIMKELYD